MFVVVTYDIVDDRRRTKVAKILENIGDRVQYSVFECDLTEDQHARLRKKLVRFVKEGDSIRYYRLCNSCREKIEINGEGKVVRDPMYYLT